MRIYVITILLAITFRIQAQLLPEIPESEVYRIEKSLSSDDMQGRKINTPGIDRAAAFIANEFQEAGLKPLPGFRDYYQVFSMPDPETTSLDNLHLRNIVGMIPGRSRPDEYVIFSAHYDHLGIGKPDATGDSVYNGANDNASGTTAIIALAKYFGKLHNNDRTIIFAAFTAEEAGEFGSAFFSRQLNPDKVTAMFNIEMIGTESKWGKNAAYITGYEKSDMGQILQKNLIKSGFKFYPDPYPEQMLFLRSDNATLAELGVPAHTISTSKMDNEKFYHTRGDEIGTLDIPNMTEIIRAIGMSARSIISGQDTPRRVRVEQ